MTKKEIAKWGEYFGIDFNCQTKFVSSKKRDSEQDVYIADIHAPFHNQKLVEQTINDTVGKCTDVYIVGDAWDFYSKSFYRKKASVSFEWEFKQGYELLRTLSGHFRKVYMMMSNHDTRFAKHLYDNVPMEYLSMCNANLIEDLVQTIPNLEIIKQTMIDGRVIEYLVQKKNVLFSHVEISYTDIGKVVQEVFRRVGKWETFLQLKPYDTIIQAHNHQSAKLKVGDKTLFQIPCLIDSSKLAFDYAFDGKFKGNPPALGYLLAQRTNGKFDAKKSHIIDY